MSLFLGCFSARNKRQLWELSVYVDPKWDYLGLAYHHGECSNDRQAMLSQVAQHNPTSVGCFETIFFAFILPFLICKWDRDEGQKGFSQFVMGFFSFLSECILKLVLHSYPEWQWKLSQNSHLIFCCYEPKCLKKFLLYAWDFFSTLISFCLSKKGQINLKFEINLFCFAKWKFSLNVHSPVS